MPLRLRFFFERSEERNKREKETKSIVVEMTNTSLRIRRQDIRLETGISACLKRMPTARMSSAVAALAVLVAPTAAFHLRPPMHSARAAHALQQRQSLALPETRAGETLSRSFSLAWRICTCVVTGADVRDVAAVFSTRNRRTRACLKALSILLWMRYFAVLPACTPTSPRKLNTRANCTHERAHAVSLSLARVHVHTLIHPHAHTHTHKHTSQELAT